MSEGCLLGVFLVVEYPTGVCTEEFAAQSVEMEVFGCGESRDVKTFIRTKFDIASRFTVVNIHSKLVVVEVQRQFRFLWLVFLLVGKVEIIAQEQPAVTEIKTYFRTQVWGEFKALVAGFGTDFKVLLPRALLQSEN